MQITEEIRGGLPIVILPQAHMVLSGKEPGASLTLEEEDIYNVRCNEMIVSALAVKREKNLVGLSILGETGGGGRMSAEERASLIEILKVPMIRTRYPKDNSGSEDVVSLDEDGNIVVLDVGTS